MYKSNNGDIYADMEETILACLLLEPKLMEKLIVEEKHFRKFGYLLTFFKEFYAKYHNLDVSLMFSVVKNNSEIALIDAITYLVDIFVLPSHFQEYQNRLIELYNQQKKEEWLKKKIFEKATQLYVDKIDLATFNNEIRKLYNSANKIEWK